MGTHHFPSKCNLRPTLIVEANSTTFTKVTVESNLILDPKQVVFLFQRARYPKEKAHFSVVDLDKLLNELTDFQNSNFLLESETRNQLFMIRTLGVQNQECGKSSPISTLRKFTCFLWMLWRKKSFLWRLFSRILLEALFWSFWPKKVTRLLALQPHITEKGWKFIILCFEAHELKVFIL